MLNVRYVYDDTRTFEQPVSVRECRGSITYGLYRGLYLPEGVAALNASTHLILDGGQWFQLWKGEIVSMYSPETREDAHAGVHRGPLADQATGPIHR